MKKYDERCGIAEVHENTCFLHVYSMGDSECRNNERDVRRQYILAYCRNHSACLKSRFWVLMWKQGIPSQVEIMYRKKGIAIEIDSI